MRFRFSTTRSLDILCSSALILGTLFHHLYQQHYASLSTGLGYSDLRLDRPVLSIFLDVLPVCLILLPLVVLRPISSILFHDTFASTNLQALRSSLWRILCILRHPLKWRMAEKVKFLDVVLVDCYTSLAGVFYGNGRKSTLRLFLGCLPFLLRLHQCITSYLDSESTVRQRHMLNSLKYCLLILALLSSHFMPAMRTGSELNVPSLIALVSQMYSLYWDLFQDFSLPKTLTHYRARKRSGVGATWWIAIVGVDVLVRGFRMLLSTRSPHEFVVMAAKKSVPPSASCLLEEAIRRLWWVVGRVSAENVALQEGATLHSSSDEDLSQKNTTYEDGLATINGNGSRTVEIMSHSPELSLSGREYSATVCSKQNQT